MAGTIMKTTVDIADPLLGEAKRLAAESGSTLRALIEEGLRHVVANRRAKQPFRLKDGSFRGKGRGLRPEYATGGWEKIRGVAYER
jgi:hypothetical protein